MKTGFITIALILSICVQGQTWFATFNQNSKVEHSGYSISDDLEEFSRHYDSKIAKGFVLVSTEYTSEGWFSVYQKGEEYSEGSFVIGYTLEGLKTKIKEEWDKDFNLGSLAFGNGTWIAVMVKSPYITTSGYNSRTSLNELILSVPERTANGFHLTSVAGSNDSYMGAFQKISTVSESKVLRASSKSAIATEIKENWAGSWDLSFVQFIDGEYIAVLYQNKYIDNSAYNYKEEESVIKTDIKSRWDTEYDLVKITFEPGESTFNALAVNNAVEVVPPVVAREYIEFSDGASMALTNLAVVNFSNGDPIPLKDSPEEWYIAGKNGEPAYCYVNGDPSTVDQYGLLYNWYAVHDERGLSPEGFSVASPEDFEKLSIQLSTEKSSGKSNTTLVDYFGLKATGCRVYKGQFRYFNSTSMWWSKAGVTAAPASYKLMINGMILSKEEYFKEMGMAVRLIKEP